MVRIESSPDDAVQRGACRHERPRWPSFRALGAWVSVVAMLLAWGHPTLAAVELPFLTVGPEFEIRLKPSDEPLRKDLRDLLVTQRQTDVDFTLYDTPAKFARAELENLRKALRARGYYQATAHYEVEADDIHYHVRQGPLYRIDRIRFNVPEGVDWSGNTRIGLQSGQALDAEGVLKGLETFRRRVAARNCLYRVDATYVATIDHDTRLATLEYQLAPSPQVRFGQTTLRGLENVRSDYLEHKLTYQPGDCFQRSAIESTRVEFMKTNLIATLEHTISEPVDGQVDVSFDLTERLHRTFKAGVGYSTDERGILILGWEHRNLKHSGEVLTFDTRLSQVLQTVEGKLLIPDFGHPDQTGELRGDLTRESRDAYNARSIEAEASLTRQITQEWRASIGIGQKISTVDDNGDRTDSALQFYPATTTWDSTDDLLDPRRGHILTLQVIPYVDLLQTGTRFVKTIVSGSLYRTRRDWFWRPTFGLRLATGAMTGEPLNDIPSDERYYSGGGGSVRGYAYQTLTDYEGGDPVGGRSFSEVSFETRLRQGENWGTVLFIDGGYAFREDVPRWDADLYWGAGIGLRYYTTFAPLRLDVAMPLQRREGIDDSYQLYISIGQAF